MAKTIQVRNVPETLHRQLKARAALAGTSLSDYLLGELQRAANRPTFDEIRQRIAQRTPVRLLTPAAALVRAQRDGQ